MCKVQQLLKGIQLIGRDRNGNLLYVWALLKQVDAEETAWMAKEVQVIIPEKIGLVIRPKAQRGCDSINNRKEKELPSHITN